MSKVANIYWDNNSVSLPKMNSRSKTRTSVKQTKAAPQWLVFTIAVSMTFMLCLTINLRAFTELNAEIGQNQQLSIEVERLTDENLILQEQIHNLKTDPTMIEREARKFGIGRIEQ